MMFASVTIIGVLVYPMTVLIVLIVFAHLKFLGLILLTAKATFINTLNVLIVGYATVIQANANVLKVMRGKRASEQLVQMTVLSRNLRVY
jgi:hypothetical protein